MQYSHWQYGGYQSQAYYPPAGHAGPSTIPTSHIPAYPPSQPVTFPQQQYQPSQPPYPSSQYGYPTSHAPPIRQSPAPSRGREYLLSLQNRMSNLQLDQTQYQQRPASSPGTPVDKPLPRLPPPPPLPIRPVSSTASEREIDFRHERSSEGRPTTDNGNQTKLNDYYPVERPSSTPQKLAIPSNVTHHSVSMPSTTNVDPLPTLPRVIPSSTHTPPKSFRTSMNLDRPGLHPYPASEPRISRPKSDDLIPLRKSKPKAKGKKGSPKDPIYINDSDTSTSSSSNTPGCITDRSPARRKRATSERPPPSTSSPVPKGAGAVKCAGFTRKGQPCQRLVKSQAPYLARLDQNLPEDERVVARYCKDHAGMICNAEGFYWRGNKETAGVWIDFGDYIPLELGQQTQALLRMTMESPLTDKEAQGYLYAYELRDLQSTTTSFFKVGRTDNVARRIGEWTTRCSSHTPTLRDVFPIKPHVSDTKLSRNPSAAQSYLPGAMRQSSNPQRTCPAVKRWERLVHLELADRAHTTAPREYEGLKERCDDCQAVHREIFPLANQERVYEDVVREGICRWERFVRKICSDQA